MNTVPPTTPPHRPTPLLTAISHFKMSPKSAMFAHQVPPVCNMCGGVVGGTGKWEVYVINGWVICLPCRLGGFDVGCQQGLELILCCFSICAG